MTEITSDIIKLKEKNSKRIIGARITGSDHLKNGIKIEDAIYLVKKLKRLALIMYVFQVVYQNKNKLKSKNKIQFKSGI